MVNTAPLYILILVLVGGPDVPVVPDRVEAVKSPSGFLKAASELLIQAPIGTDN